VRVRVAVILSLAVLVTGGLVALDRLVGPVSPAVPGPHGQRSGPGESSGAWFCPHSGGEGWRAWIAVANPSGRPATLRLTTVGASGGTVETPAEVAPRSSLYLEVPADQPQAASTVEFFGAPVGAGMIVSLPRRDGLAADPCAPDAARTWVVPGGTTIREQRARLVIMNPFAIEATVDVVIAAPRRVLRPGPLRGLVLPPRRSRSVDLNRYALGEEAVAAMVQASLGRVVAGGMGISTTGIRSAIGVSSPARTWVLPGDADDGTTDLQVVVPGREEVPLRVRAQRDGGQAPLVDEASVEAGFAKSFELEAQGASLVVESAGQPTMVVSRRTGSFDSGDGALTAGASAGPARWLAMPASGPGGLGARLLLVNPGAGTAHGRVTLLSETGPLDAPALGTVTIGAGRLLVVDLTSVAGLRPVAALVEVNDGTMVPAQESISIAGYTVSVGIPLEVF
jgi:hypothetical protein